MSKNYTLELNNPTIGLKSGFQIEGLKELEFESFMNLYWAIAIESIVKTQLIASALATVTTLEHFPEIKFSKEDIDKISSDIKTKMETDEHIRQAMQRQMDAFINYFSEKDPFNESTPKEYRDKYYAKLELVDETSKGASKDMKNLKEYVDKALDVIKDAVDAVSFPLSKENKEMLVNLQRDFKFKSSSFIEAVKNNSATSDKDIKKVEELTMLINELEELINKAIVK